MDISLKTCLTGHQSAIYALSAAATPRSCFSADGNGWVVYWQDIFADKGTIMAKVPSNVFGLHYLPQSNWLALGSMQGIVYRIALQHTQNLPQALQLPPPVFALQSFADQLLVGAGNGWLYSLNPDTWQISRTLQIADKGIRQIALHPHLPIAALACSDKKVHIVALDQWKILQSLSHHKHSVFSVCFSPNGKYLFSGSRDAHLAIWETNNFELHHSIPAHLYTINSLVCSPDSNYLFSGSRDKSLKMWHIPHFQLLKVWSPDKPDTAAHHHSINSLLYLPQSHCLVSASDDKRVLVWQMNT
jgi:hypothetical protein